jgi:outer membrane protein TolC
LAGKERALTKFGALLPTLSSSATMGRETINLDEMGIPQASGVTDPFSVFKLQSKLTQILYDPATISRFKSAKEAAIAGAFDARYAAQVAGTDAGLAWLRAMRAIETVQARQADSAVAASLLSQAKQMVEAGVSPAIDATRSEVSFTAVLTDLEVARNARDGARLDLLRALDFPATANLELEFNPETPDPVIPIPMNPDSAAALALTKRPDLIAQQKRVAAEKRSTKAIRMEGYPALTVGGSFGMSGQSAGELSRTWSAQLGVSLSLFDGFQRRHRAAEQQINADIEALKAHDLAEQIQKEARQAVLDLASASQQIRIANDRVRLAAQELHEAQQRFTAGVAGSVETTNAQGSLIAARDALIQAHVNEGTARVNAYRALGLLGPQ